MVSVTTAEEALALDSATIGEGVPSRALMQRAGAAAAAEITTLYHDRLRNGVVVFAGPGNNGGDAWVVARALHTAGVTVRVISVGTPREGDASAERKAALAVIAAAETTGAEQIIVDGLLGTGSKGAPRGQVAEHIARVRELRERGAAVVSLDIPSGVDATTGSAKDAVVADVTLTFGTMKRGLLVARSNAGRILVLDIGLASNDIDTTPQLVDAQWVARRIPPITADAHKGQRKRLAIVGGGMGMAGAAILAARSAMRSGIGIVRLFLARDNVPVAQIAAPEALAKPWPGSADEVEANINDWAHGLVVGPGLGKSDETRILVEQVLSGWRGPVVVDADALNVFEGEAQALGALLAGRPALITPHASECGRLLGISPQDVMANRFDVGAELASIVNAVVLLKGVPTIVSSPEGGRLVSAAGTPALGAAGSGDVLAGIAGTLITQREEAFESAAASAWVHGRAGEIASNGEPVRGIALDRVMAALPRAWRIAPTQIRYPVLAELPRIEVDEAR